MLNNGDKDWIAKTERQDSIGPNLVTKQVDSMTTVVK